MQETSSEVDELPRVAVANGVERLEVGVDAALGVQVVIDNLSRLGSAHYYVRDDRMVRRVRASA